MRARWARSSSAVNSNPYVYEVGLGGAYKSLASSITKKAYFMDNGQTHVHIGVIHAYGTCHSASCDEPASSTEDPTTDPAQQQQPGTPATPTGGTGTCQSATLGQSVPAGTCVQRADDSKWYVCDGSSPGAWPTVSGPTDAQCTS